VLSLGLGKAAVKLLRSREGGGLNAGNDRRQGGLPVFLAEVPGSRLPAVADSPQTSHLGWGIAKVFGEHSRPGGLAQRQTASSAPCPDRRV
jgi:hypothetical protein